MKFWISKSRSSSSVIVYTLGLSAEVQKMFDVAFVHNGWSATHFDYLLELQEAFQVRSPIVTLVNSDTFDLAHVEAELRQTVGDEAEIDLRPISCHRPKPPDTFRTFDDYPTGGTAPAVITPIDQ